MAITITKKPASYYLQNDAQGHQPPISAMELSNIFVPDSLGYVMAEQLGKGSILTQLGMQAQEFTTSSDQVMWREEGDMLVSSANKATFTLATKTFAVNPATFPVDADNIDSAVPTDAQWVGISENLRFTVFDSTGKQNWGWIKTIAADGKSFTAEAQGGTFDIGANVEVMFTNYNLDDCECPPCVAIKNWSPTYENTLVKHGTCVNYCEETMIKEGVQFDFVPMKDGKTVTVDTRLNDAQKKMNDELENTFLFDKKLTQAEATAMGKDHVGTNGVITQLEKRAVKIEGMITTQQDIRDVIAILKSNEVYTATIHCSAAQFSAIQALFPPTSAYNINPFENHETDLIYLGFGGFKMDGVIVRFKELTALDRSSAYLAKKYNFFIVPEGKLSRLINGKREQVGYLNAVYFAGNNKVWKMLREEERNADGHCGTNNIRYFTKVAPVIFMARKFILGVAAA